MSAHYLGYLGPVGSFSGEAAALYLKGTSHSMEPYPHLVALVEAYLEKEVERAILPIENSIEGAVTLTMDLLQEKRVQVVDEVVISIQQNLLLLPGTLLSELKKILSHPQGVAQSRSFIKGLTPTPTIEYTASTAEAARRVKEEGKRDQGAIASLMAAEHFQLQVAAQGIQDNSENRTRFVILGEEVTLGESMKTSIIVSPRVNRPGILYEILRSFADYAVDLTRIESRPTKKALGEYIFYIDLEGYLQDEPIQKALADVRKRSSWMKILGTYRRWPV